jgi:hypothetical protein
MATSALSTLRGEWWHDPSIAKQVALFGDMAAMFSVYTDEWPEYQPVIVYTDGVVFGHILALKSAPSPSQTWKRSSRSKRITRRSGNTVSAERNRFATALSNPTQPVRIRFRNPV